MKILAIELDLQFFSAEGEGRTEKATPKKREDARKKGQVAKSNELNTAVILGGFFVGMMALGSYYLEQSKQQIQLIFTSIPTILDGSLSTTNGLILEVGKAIQSIILINGPLWMGLFVAGLLVSFIQVGYKPTFSTMAPKFSKMNPLTGIKRMVSAEMLVELLKSLGKVAFLGAIFLSVIQDVLPVFLKFYDMTSLQILNNVGNTVMTIGMNVGGAFLFLAVLDYAYQRYKFEDSIKMSKQDIKDEYKQSEGDPQIKGKIKQKMREMSMNRMMQAIPEADVIITNPTHFAIAIAYNSDKHGAPVVVAKGVDYVAQKIKEKAKEHKVYIMENKPLARMLYYTVEIEQPIPPELYAAVAEVLAFVYGLNENRRQK